MGKFEHVDGAMYWVPDIKNVEEPESILLTLPVISYPSTDIQVAHHNNDPIRTATVCLDPDSYCTICKLINSCIYIHRRYT